MILIHESLLASAETYLQHNGFDAYLEQVKESLQRALLTDDQIPVEQEMCIKLMIKKISDHLINSSMRSPGWFPGQSASTHS